MTRPSIPADVRPLRSWLSLYRKLSKVRTEADTGEALRAFIAVRRKYVPRYAARAGEVAITPEQLAAAIHALVLEDSEGGKRAQAVCTEN